MRRFWLGLVAGALLLPLGTLAAAALGLMGTDTAPNPPLWEASLAHLAFTRSVERHADSLPNPVSPTEDELRLVSGSTPTIAAVSWIPESSQQLRPRLHPRARQFADSPPSRLAELLDHDQRDSPDSDGGVETSASGREAVAGRDVSGLATVTAAVDSLWRHAGES